MNPAEVRTVTEPVEVRAAEGEAGKPVIRGYAAVFGSPSQTLRTDEGEPFIETIRPGAFKKAIEGMADVRALFNHDSRYLLGRRGAGTLRVEEDAHGLRYEVDAPDTGYARDLMESIRRGDITGSSFSFVATDDDWSIGPDGVAVRELRSVHLFDVGPVTYPAYRAATATCRSLDAFLASKKVVYPTPEQVAHLHFFRSAGF